MAPTPISRRAFLAGALAAAAAPAVTGCASLNAYRDRPELAQSRYATIENFSSEPADPAAIDALVEEVARVLGVTLDPARRRVRIVVTTPTRIARLYGSGAAAFPGHSQAVGLYFPGASVLLVPSFERTVLAHELAHYVTDHYLKHVPRGQWERIAHQVERRLA
jgi:hypothetical protein